MEPGEGIISRTKHLMFESLELGRNYSTVMFKTRKMIITGYCDMPAIYGVLGMYYEQAGASMNIWYYTVCI